MDIKNAKIVPDLRVFQAINVSKETGRKRMEELQSIGVIAPLRTPTGRCLLSYDDVERLAREL